MCILPTKEIKDYFRPHGYSPSSSLVQDEAYLIPGGFPNRAAEFWLDKILLPITPYNWKVNNNNGNESDQLVDGDPLTVPKKDKAQTFSMDFIFLHDQHYKRDIYNSFLRGTETDGTVSKTTDTLSEVKDLTDFLWNKKIKREPFILTIVYPFQKSLNLRAMLDDYTYTQSAENASDYEFNLTFTEYREALNQEVDIELKTTLAKHNIRALRKIGGPMPLTPITYETVTGKHTMTWEEMRNQMEAWLKGEYGKISDKEYTNFDDAFKAWWDSDPTRKTLHRPDTNKELKNWWIDFMQKSDAEQATNNKLASIEAWLNGELRKAGVTEIPSDFWSKFKLWWRSNPELTGTLHRPNTQAELFNWWDDFMAKSKEEQELQRKFESIKAWLDAELRKITKNPPDDFWVGLKMWWDYDPDRAKLHCPTDRKELFNWWDDFMKLTDENKKLLEDIQAWLNEEVRKLTNSPPSTFKEKFAFWWNSDEERKNTMHMPDSDAELINWWKDFMEKSKQEQENQQKLADIKAWLNAELDKIVLDTPDDFWEGFRIWWNSDENRKNNPELHCPDNYPELFNWWDDFMEKSKAEQEERED